MAAAAAPPPEAFLVPPPPPPPAPSTPAPPDPPRPRNGLRPPNNNNNNKRRGSSCGAKQPAWKRRRRAASECGPVLPSEFLLGGNIFDPLNLNSLLDEEVSRALNARTPQSSPLPQRGRDPVEILVPRDITDPLSLNAPGEDGPHLAAVKKKPKYPSNKPSQRPRRQARKFQYGNYCKYYGYRNPDVEDSRLRALKPEWFRGKEVLDVGCNVGHLTLSIAKRWGPSKMVGLDIDGRLIRSARQNIRHYLSEGLGMEGGEEGKGKTRKGFPAALCASRGPIAAPQLPPDGPGAGEFPHNVVFVTGNYVPEREEAVGLQRPEFDVVLLLSLTKWVQLNWGDEGLKRLFRRAFRHLRPGGLLLLEPQPWESYRKRKGLTETTYRNYQRIRLRPEQFPAYLTSPEVGFERCELLGTPHHGSKGFQRPIYLFHKGQSDAP
ncbi:hypothetical protein HGM15179_017330 [Zosterops borbonicus]|uniref:RNA methyltransferase n=1 Tax=Zosterops borbonicus TaxID=364589 RepID=A0A8K1LDG7_9PASS|nr:hypothetical protein HGM15179_017330 [Zosterops borbonicus]